MFSIKSLVLCLTLFAALVSAVPRPLELYHRSLHAIGAREAEVKELRELVHELRELEVRSSRRRCKTHTAKPKPKATVHAHAADNTPHSDPPKPKAAPKKDPAPKGASTGGGGGGGGSHTGGVATFFFQHGTAGACGKVHSDNDLICAMDSALYGDTGRQSPLCGKQVRITNKSNGKSVTVTVADACPTCNNANSIDLSTGAFDRIADRNTGEVPIVWDFA